MSHIKHLILCQVNLLYTYFLVDPGSRIPQNKSNQSEYFFDYKSKNPYKARYIGEKIIYKKYLKMLDKVIIQLYYIDIARLDLLRVTQHRA